MQPLFHSMRQETGQRNW